MLGIHHQYANVGRRGGLSHKALWDLLLAAKQFIQVTEILLRWWEGIWQVMWHLNICNTVYIHPHIQIRVAMHQMSQKIHNPANILQTSYWGTQFSAHFPCKIIKTLLSKQQNFKAIRIRFRYEEFWKSFCYSSSPSQHLSFTKNFYIFTVNKHV